MDYAKMIEEAETRLEDLKQMKEYLYRIEEAICAIEKETSDIDNSLPTDEEIRRMREGEAKRQILKLIELDNTTFDIIDEILGPPTEETDLLKGIPTSACAS